MTSSTVGLRRSSKALPKAKLPPRKGHGQCLMVVWWSAESLIQYKFLNPSETTVSEKYAQQIDNYWKLRCFQLVLINRAQFFSKLHNQCFRSWINWVTRFCLILSIHRTSCQPTISSSNFLQGKCFYNQQEAENAFQEFVESQSTDFYATGINKHFLLAKTCWLEWFLFWLIKMCLNLVIVI